MKFFILLTVLTIWLQVSLAPPVTKKKNGQNEEESEIGGLEDYMEYHRYLKEVVNALESDAEFKDKLEKAHENDIKSGKIAEELEFVSHHVRTRLDEIKRVELERLKELTEKKRDLLNNIDHEDPSHKHLDRSNPHTFEIDDLKKLIAKTTEDLAEADRKRREEFKEYELQKEYERQNKLNHTNGEQREKLEKEYKEMEEKHKKHEKLHEPGHKAQLEEVWEEQDQMQQEFDPKTFFLLHDLDSNGLWDQDEVKALFIKELDKMYSDAAPEDDMRERVEEMERMRESVFKEIDLNKDGFIDYSEFLSQTKRNGFKQDHGWQGIDEQRPYNDEELQAYIREQQAHDYYKSHGYPVNGPPGGGRYPQAPPPAYQQIPQGYHPNNIPQQQQQQFHHGQVPQQQFHPGQASQQQFHPGQAPQQQFHPGQVPQQQIHSGQVPQQQFQPGQVQQQQQQQIRPGQVPQQQYHPGQAAQHVPQQLPGHLPDLNTNEVYPNQPGDVPAQNSYQQVNPQQQQKQQQNYPAENDKEHVGNVIVDNAQAPVNVKQEMNEPQLANTV